MSLLIQFTDYLKLDRYKLSKKTVKNYRADVKKFIEWYEEKIGQKLDSNPSGIALQILDLYKKAKREHLSARSFKRHLSSLRRFFRFLKTERIISQNPFDQLKILSNNALASQDKWHLREFKNYLYLNNKSNLTIKNYILDIQHFLNWVEQVTLAKDAKYRQENMFAKIVPVLINEYKERLIDHQFSPRTINRKLSSIRQYLKWTTREVPSEISPANWADQISNSTKDIILDHALKITGEQTKPTEKILTRYSPFPPLRLIQKTLRGIGFIFDKSLIVPLIKLTDSLNYLKPKPIFKEISNIPAKQDLASPDKLQISNLPKDMYAPLSISTRYFPWHKKVLRHIRHTRPNWYKKYHSHTIAHYFHLATLILFASYLGFAMYQTISQNQQTRTSILGTLVTAVPRILSFDGKLTDNLNNPIIVNATPLRMAIYNDETATGSSLLWQEVVLVSTGSEGKFSTTLGNNVSLPQSLFSENQALWLGVAIGESPELTPREQLANVGLASNAEKLQGLPLITNPNSDTKNVVLALDSSGNLTIDADASPTFQATGGTFKLLGQTLVLSTTPGTNSNVEIAPMDLGKIDLQKPIFNSTNNNNIHSAIGAVEIDDSLSVLATSSAEAAFTITQTSTGQLISAYKEGVAKFAVDNNGDIISQQGVKWQPFSNSTSALNIANATGNTFLSFDTSNSRVLFIQDATERGAVFYQNSDSTFHVRSSNSLALDTNNSNTPKVYIAASGNVGIGTTSPGFRLDVRDDQAASAAAQIFNTNTGTDADGLVVKLGNTSTTTVDSTNHFISFETSGLGIVGSVQGSGGTGVDFRTSGIADFAEYLKKDESQNIPYGSLVCIDEKGLVLPCDQINNKIIGIASPHGGFTGGIDEGETSIRVGLIGQVYTRVSTINGNIKPGDPLTSSLLPGVAVKAVSPGQIIGRALEAFECTLSTTNENTNDHEQISGASCQGKILVAIGVSWYDPYPHLISPLASNSDQPTSGTFAQGLLSLGPTSLSDTSITGQLSIERNFIFANNSINVLGGNLELQPLRQGGLSIMGGLVYIDTNGNLKVEGNAEFAKNIMVGGDLIASGSGTFSKLNLKLAKKALAISAKEIIATGSAGTAFVRAYEQEVTINNNLVTDKSLIFITPVGTPSGQIPYLIRQTPEKPTTSPSTTLGLNSVDGSFTVGIASKSATTTPFNWLIIN